MTRWEYMTLQLVAAGFEDPAGTTTTTPIMNEYGQQGWELVSASATPAGCRRTDRVCSSRRPRDSPVPTPAVE